MTISNIITGGIGPGSSISDLILDGLYTGSGTPYTATRTGLRRNMNTLLIPNRPLIQSSNPTLWLDPTLSMAKIGTAISGWGSRTGSTLLTSFLQANAAKKPTYVADGLNSLPVVSFDGGDGLSKVDDLITYTGRLMMVAKTTVTDAAQVLYAQADAETTDVHLCFGISAANKMWYRFTNGAFVIELVGGTSLSTDWHILEWSCDDYEITMTLDGVAETNTVVQGADNGSWFADLTGLDNSSLGAVKPSTGETTYLTGSIAEVLAWEPDKTEAVLTKIRAKLTTKYGL